jgi:glycosyltransferase involved in cell wall biosynthesis
MNHNSISFSIIIPTYNRGDIISHSIESALKQGYANFEVIVVDDGSKDQTEKIVKSIHNPCLFYYKKDNAERGAARNFGIEKAKGDYITFFDSDDILYPNFLQNAYDVAVKHDLPPFFHLAYEIKNQRNKILHKMNYIKSDDTDFIKRGNYLSCIGVFIRKDVVNNFKFNEDIRLSGSEDWELWIRLIAHHGIKTDNRISACLIHHKGRSVSTVNESKLLIRKNLSLFYAFRDEAVREKFGRSIRKIESHILTYISLHLALAGKKKRSIVYLRKALFKNPYIIFERRIGAIIKYLAFNSLRRKNETIDLG